MFFTLRRSLFPTIDKTPIGKAYRKFSFKAHHNEFAGVVEGVSTTTLRQHLASMENVYEAHAAAVKYLETDDGEEVYEHGSYAHRPNGRFGKWQTHIRLFPHEEGTAIYAHHELNPLHSPIAHYHSKHWDAPKGRSTAQQLLNTSIDYKPPSYDDVPAFMKRNSKTNALIKSIAIPLMVAAVQQASTSVAASGIAITEDIITASILFAVASVCFYIEELLKDKQIATLTSNADMTREQVTKLAESIGETFSDDDDDSQQNN